jgi:uncharacterized protein
MDIFWKKSGWEKEDRHLSSVHSAPFQRPFPTFTPPKGISTIRGPRQIGKSSWLKSLLLHGLSEGRKCFYLSCENVRDHLDLAEILKGIRTCDLLLLDEVTFVKEWPRAIKYEADLGTLPATVLTGSNTFDLRRGAERLPGRSGKGVDLQLLPMEFGEWCEMREKAEWATPRLPDALEMYFKTGGFPAAVIEAGSKATVPRIAIDTYKKWIIGDAVRIGKQELYLRELLGALADTLTTPVSLQTLAKKTQIGSHHTVQSYIEVLEDCFALRTLYAIDADTGTLHFKKNKKFYFADPIIFWLALDWSGYALPENWQAMLAEMVAAEMLLRRFPRVGYSMTRKGEIDFVAPKQWAVEVKWSTVATNLSRAFIESRLPEKLVWTKEQFGFTPHSKSQLPD